MGMRACVGAKADRAVGHAAFHMSLMHWPGFIADLSFVFDCGCIRSDRE